MTLEDLGDMEQAQSGLCGVCRQPFTGSPHVDHDHDTETVRGLLCRSCNLALGHLKDSPAVLAMAIRYLHRHGKALATEDLRGLLDAIT